MTEDEIDGWHHRIDGHEFEQAPDESEPAPGSSLEGMMLKLKLQYFGHLMRELTHLKRP